MNLKWRVRLFLLTKVPLVLCSGVKFVSMDGKQCTVTIKRTWLNRNPYNATYFAAVMAAGEMAGGVPLFNEVLKNTHKGMTAAIATCNAKFVRPVTRAAEFKFKGVQEIKERVTSALIYGQADVLNTVYGYNVDTGKLCAEVNIVWTIKVRK